MQNYQVQNIRIDRTIISPTLRLLNYTLDNVITKMAGARVPSVNAELVADDFTFLLCESFQLEYIFTVINTIALSDF